MKTCFRCSLAKPPDSFGKNAARRDGLAAYCLACARKYMRTYKAQNRERMAELQRRWAESNPEAVRAKSERYHARHPHKRKEWNERRRVSGRRRLANLLRRGRSARMDVASLHGRFEVHGWRCYYCRNPLNVASVQADHRIPVARGGMSVPANIVPSCARCNRRKATRTETEFRLLIGGDGPVGASHI